MAERSLLAEVITPERIVYAGEVDMVVAPTTAGEVGILPLHIPYIGVLAPGVLRVKMGDDEEALAVGGGFIEVNEDRVSVLADDAELAGAIDVARAHEAEARAQAELDEALGAGDKQSIESCQKALRTAAARIKAAGMARKG
jgi:F-type H+-transporting ATPase subunit epsilon